MSLPPCLPTRTRTHSRARDRVNRLAALPVACVLTWALGSLADDWPHFLGPNHNATSAETKLLKTWPEKGPKIAWEFAKGAGYACPVTSASGSCSSSRGGLRGRRLPDAVAETALPDYPPLSRALWRPPEYARSSPVIADGHVFVYGVAGRCTVSIHDRAWSEARLRPRTGSRARFSVSARHLSARKAADSEYRCQ
jgi:hypothetical protein